ncbi:MAG TPA: N-acetylmuramoyl-L-alanine amidase [Gemmatimonadaceae bacterium]|nr:N-acetylmuramoyl-L-alanine amidase [Gemmatimonadaceae bacterium]
MIAAALLAAFQLAATSPSAGRLVVKDASRSVSVPLVASPSGPLVRPEQLRPIVPLTVSHLTGDRWLLIVGGSTIEVEEGLRFARVGDATFQLARAPEVRRGALYVPLQLVVELVPRIAGNLAWDVDRFELRAFSSLSRYENSSVSQVGRSVPSAARRDDVIDGASPERTSRGFAIAASSAPSGPLRSRRLVVLDAGHGGPDAGMRGPISGGPRVAEKNITLAVAKRVGAALGQRGVGVKYTRTSDTLIALSDRGRIANEAHADLFVSIHVNAANPGWKDPGAARGFETYFLAEAKTEDARRVERMENEVVKFEARASARAGDALSFVLNDMAQNEHLRESNELAELIQRRIGRIHPGPSRGVKQAGFRVLVTAFMPAVLVEIGFGTNASEASYMTDPARMEELSAAVADGILEYLKRYERRVASGESIGSAGGVSRQ